MRIDLSGMNLDHVLAAVEAATPEALGLGMEHIITETAPNVPVETGRLVGSAEPNVDGDEASVTYAGPYARYQHERLDLRHESGKAKYLEETMVQESGTALRIVAQALRTAL
jgi:hypothetical protein